MTQASGSDEQTDDADREVAEAQEQRQEWFGTQAEMSSMQRLIAEGLGVPSEYLEGSASVSIDALRNQHELVQQRLRNQLTDIIGRPNTECVRHRTLEAAGQALRELLNRPSAARQILQVTEVPPAPEAGLSGHTVVNGTEVHLQLDDYLVEDSSTDTLLVSAAVPDGTTVVTSTGHEFYVYRTHNRHPAHGELETTAELRHSRECRVCSGGLDFEAIRGLKRTLHGACVNRIGDPPPYLGRLLPARNTMDGLFDAPELDIDMIINLRGLRDENYDFAHRADPVTKDVSSISVLTEIAALRAYRKKHAIRGSLHGTVPAHLGAAVYNKASALRIREDDYRHTDKLKGQGS